MRKIFFISVLAMLAYSGCAPIATSMPSTATLPAPPSFTPVPSSTAMPLPSATPTGIPTNTPTVPVDPTSRADGQLSPGSSIVFSTDFSNGVPSEFSGVTTIESVQGYAGIGHASNTFAGDFLRNSSVPPLPTTLRLTELPAHTGIDLHFLLAIIDSWDGYNASCCGSDRFTIMIDSKPVLSEVFNNAAGGGEQSYIPPLDVELTRIVDLGFHGGNVSYQDSAYDMGRDPRFTNITHTSSTLTIEWYAGGPRWQGDMDESWAIDNVEVILHTEGN